MMLNYQTYKRIQSWYHLISYVSLKHGSLLTINFNFSKLIIAYSDAIELQKTLTHWCSNWCPKLFSTHLTSVLHQRQIWFHNFSSYTLTKPYIVYLNYIPFSKFTNLLEMLLSSLSPDLPTIILGDLIHHMEKICTTSFHECT